LTLWRDLDLLILEQARAEQARLRSPLVLTNYI
jgi:hypothetical protein